MAGVFSGMYIYICICVLAADRQFCFENFLEKIIELEFGNGTIGSTRVQTVDLKVQQKKLFLAIFDLTPYLLLLLTFINSCVQRCSGNPCVQTATQFV